jgi:hypothetical protein
VERNRIAAACESDGTCGTHTRGARSIWEVKQGYYQTSLGELNEIAADLNAKQREFTNERTKLLAQVESDTNTSERVQLSMILRALTR